MRPSRERAVRAFPFSELTRLFYPLVSWALLFCALLLTTSLVLQTTEAYANGVAWWDSSYVYRKQLTITSNSSSALPSGYSVCLSLDHSALAETGRSLANGNDVRIVYWNGLGYTELDRINESNWNGMGINTQVWFRTQADIAGYGIDENYSVYYGNREAIAPPADRENIYEFFDDFSNYNPGQYDTSVPGTTDIIKNGDEQVWKIQSGTWNIENDTQTDGTTGKVLSHDSVSGSFYKYAYVLNKNYDNVLVEVKMRTKSGEHAQYWPFGARLNTSTGANYAAWSYANYSKILKFSSWSALSTLVSGTTRASLGDSWHTLQFALDGKKLNLYFEGISYGCYVEDTTLASGTIFAMSFGNTAVHFDDFKVRKYTTNEPSVSAASEEMILETPTVSFEKKWRLKSDGSTPADPYLGVSVNFPMAEGMPDAQASYEIQEASLTGPLSKTSSTSWQGQIDISNLPTGTFHFVATIADTAQQYLSNPNVFYISYPFYHVWTIDWEGGYVARVPYLDSLALLADEHGTPMSQLFNPYVYVSPGMAEWAKVQMTQWVLQRAQTKGDEIGLHLHMFNAYVDSAGLTPITSPHWTNRNDGYDVPFANYNYEQSLALLDFAIGLFQQRGLGRPSSFRAGGWFADEENLRALSDEGFLVDASGCILPFTGNLPNLWNLSVTSQPYHPCSVDKNTADCQPGDTDLPLLEMPNNLHTTSDGDNQIPYFDSDYSGAPFNSVRVGVLLSHDVSGVGKERVMIEQHFAHVDNFLYSSDRGAVIYATLATVRAALATQSLDPPDIVGSQDLISGEDIQQVHDPFIFRLQDPDPLVTTAYRIQISRTPDYGLNDVVVDYESNLAPTGVFDFFLGQPDSAGTYFVGAGVDSLTPGCYYWRVSAIDSKGRSSRWSRARNGGVAFMVQMPVGIEQAEAHAVPLAVSFSNPSGPSVFFNTQVPVPGNATLRIFNCSGRLLRTLQMDSIPAGVSRLYWDGRDSGGRSVSSGVYFIELSQSRKTIIKKLVLVR